MSAKTPEDYKNLLNEYRALQRAHTELTVKYSRLLEARTYDKQQLEKMLARMKDPDTEIIAPDGFCCYCLKPLYNGLNKTAEHLIPISHGGNNLKENKRPCCRDCNHWRGNRPLMNWHTEVDNMLKKAKPRTGYTLDELSLMLGNIKDIHKYIRNNKANLTQQ